MGASLLCKRFQISNVIIDIELLCFKIIGIILQDMAFLDFIDLFIIHTICADLVRFGNKVFL
ncbi:unnamed protein product [Coffea canephora]|uniref:Uncharacterized protein n=1 Tax=Coffea canephora TaxID=49390 RepID=A0A068UH75_COFCA|nr:unnamed protein product [Coffea canephora]